MHRIKDIRQSPDQFKKNLINRFVDIDIKKILLLDESNRKLIQKKETLEKEKKDISKTKDSTLFEKSKKISEQIFKYTKEQSSIKKQLDESIPDESNASNTIIAYEPVWAIGTGLTPTLEEIDMVHNLIRKHNNVFENFKIIYGGSVNVTNAKKIIDLTNVDGALIGGSSLKSAEFNKIIQD